MNEVDYCTPLFDKDKEYTECENCDGSGWTYFEWQNEDGSVEFEKITCPKCNEGLIEIEN